MAYLRLKYDPFKFIFQEGDEITKLHLLQSLDMLETRECKDLILRLIKSQMTSGGFPSKINEGVEGIKETCRNTLLLLKCRIPHDRLNIQTAVKYLLQHQRENGGWSENPDLSIPTETVELSTTQSITWLTADIIVLLRRIGLEKSESCTKALNWLRKMQNQDGTWAMFPEDRFGRDPDSTAQILFMMREIYGENDSAWLKGRNKFEKFLDTVEEDIERGYHINPAGEKSRNDIYHLTHLLVSSLVDTKSRIKAAYDSTDPRVKKIILAIINSQAEDGSWAPFWTQDGDPLYTVLALKLLVWLDVLDPEELRKQVEINI